MYCHGLVIFHIPIFHLTRNAKYTHILERYSLFVNGETCCTQFTLGLSNCQIHHIKQIYSENTKKLAHKDFFDFLFIITCAVMLLIILIDNHMQ